MSHERRQARPPWATIGLAAWLGAAGCTAIASIEEASLDPALDGTGAGGAAGAGGEAGAAGAAAMPEAPADAGNPSPDSAPEETLCETYCRTVMENCSDAHRVYPTEALCLSTCPYLPEGTPGDEIGNSVHCRLINAELARTTGEVEVHCPIAGPGGAGVCGDDCDAYCLYLEGACGVRFEETFLGLPDCVAQCSELPTLETFDVSLEMRSSNTVQCRLYHVSSATADPSRHCGHAVGEPPCVD